MVVVLELLCAQALHFELLCWEGIICGEKIIVYPPTGSKFDPKDNTVIGNVCLYLEKLQKVYVFGAQEPKQL